MPRPPKCRRVGALPGTTYFKPAGIPLRLLEENRLNVEEIESIRLHDLEHLEQAEGAVRMNISRPTFQRLLASARRKIADSLLSGKALRIEGGHYELEENQVENERRNKLNGGKEENMKIAVVSEDGTTISQHFGMAPWYMVYTIEDGKVTNTEKREKAGHHNMGGQGHEHPAHDHSHAHNDPAAQNLHGRMAGSINDCKAVIAGGMGMGAYESLKSFKIEPIITDERTAEEAVKLYIQGKLINLRERLH